MKKKACWLAVDVGGSSVKVALWDGCRLQRQDRIDIANTIADGDWLSRLLRSKVDSCGGLTILSAAVGVPALVDTKQQIILESTNLGWRNYPLAQILKEALRIPVRLDTDVLFAARAEAQLGAGRDSADFIYINLGTGVSHVRMLHAEPQLGAHGLGMNLGHAPLFSRRDDRIHKLCACGRPYCVESVIGGRVVATALRRLREGEQRRFWCQYGKDLGIVFSCVASLLDPERIVLGGGICASRTLFESSMRAAFHQHTLHPRKLSIVRFSALGDVSGLIGAGLAAQQTVHG
jgi:glucokinase